MESKSERNLKFQRWLNSVCQSGVASCHAMQGDASTRQYSRIVTPTGSYVAMDAPPPENCRAFVSIASALRALGLHAPEVFAADIQEGFLLLSDFGDTTYLRAMSAEKNIALADELYIRALRALHLMQSCRHVTQHTLDPFGREWMEREWAWHQDWFLQKLLGLNSAISPVVHQCYEQLINSALSQPQVFMHRDFHSANLMVLQDKKVGILDFQDAFIGPLTYDAVSLLRDCYIDWPVTNVHEWAAYYANLHGVPVEIFMRWFDWMGLQRHIKALMTFARKAVRDQQPRYLQYVPRTLNYIITVSAAYPELKALHKFYSETVQKALKSVELLCVQ